MQGTMDILAMMQRTVAVKQKPSAPSIVNSSEKSSFKSELAEAKKSMAAADQEQKPVDQVRQETEKSSKIEKLAKVMSSNKAVTEKGESTQEAASDVQKTADAEKTTEAQKASGNETADEKTAAVADNQADQSIDELKTKPDEALAELVESLQAAVQQLMQLISGNETAKQGENQESVKQLEESIQALSQKLEQMLPQSTDAKAIEADAVLKELKLELKDLSLELKDLVKQIKAQTNEAKETSVDKPSLQQTVETMKQLINKMNEIKPMLQQKLAKTEVTPEEVEQEQGSELQVRQDKEVAAKAANPSAKPEATDGTVKLNETAESSTQEDTSKDSKGNEDETKYKAETKDASKHQITADKHKSEGFKILNALPNDKTEAQINIRDLNLNLKKDQMVTVNKSDIINQVIKKADVILHEGHSEMVMKLEPESLGKLNLKIVVERGLVTAKFIAESQQVKEVLESSFNQLKDALQEKGIAVQNFSVSVGSQTGDSSSNQSFNQWKQSLKIKNRAVGDFIGLDDDSVMNQNPYNYHDGKFDYKA